MYTEDGMAGITGTSGPIPGPTDGSISGPVYTGTSTPPDRGTVVAPRNVEAEEADTAVSAREGVPRGAAGTSESKGCKKSDSAYMSYRGSDVGGKSGSISNSSGATGLIS